jgi:D-arginine dehydrogenase
MVTRYYDVLVVGAGVAGAAIAESLASSSDARIGIVEAAPTPGLHSSGRSVAVFDPLYGDEFVQALSAASRPVLEGGLDGHGPSLLSPRDLILVGTPAQAESLDEKYPIGMCGIDRLGEDELQARFPALCPGTVLSGVRHRGGADLDVARLHEGLLASARRGGVDVLLGHSLDSLAPASGSGWWATVGAEQFHVGTLVNAAGAWADHVATLAGAAPLGVVAHRRSVGVATSRFPSSSQWAMIVDVDMGWYIRPDAGSFLLSPADATPVGPGDPRPDELELARAIEAINETTTLAVRSLTRTWAGLRTYTADERPIIGFDPHVPDFFWHAAFGGFGLQVAPAAGRLGADLLAGRATALDPSPYSPARLQEVL